MGQTTEYDMGLDADRNWILNSEGDLKLVGGSDNLSQAIYNRLTCYLGNLKWCYGTGYGSTMKDWLGKNNTEINRVSLMKEIEKRVEEDIRVSDAEIEIVDYQPNYLGIRIDATIVEDNSHFEEYFLFSTDVRNHGTHYNINFDDTYITSRRYGYYAKPGELITVHCHVISKRTELRVPVGMVSCFIGGYHVDTLMIDQSGEDEPASVTFTFRTPLFIALGEHELIFEYHGIHGFNPCKQSFAFYVVDKLPTYITFEDESTYTAGVGEDPVTVHNKVRDYNGKPAELGEIEYTITDVNMDIYTINEPIVYYKGEVMDEKVVITTDKSIINMTNHFVFELSRSMFTGDVIKLVTPMDTIFDKLLVEYVDGVYHLISVAFLEEDHKMYNHCVTTTTTLRLLV